MAIEKGELRLTGGERRGAKLYTVSGDEVRPATARLRKSLFDILGPRVEDAIVVDLFGGTGSLAWEALSRGARTAYLFETSPDCVEAIRKNGDKLRYGEKAILFETTAYDAPHRLHEPADIVFVDPPYRLYETEWDRLREAISGLSLAEGALVILEHRKQFDPPPQIGPLTHQRSKRYGSTELSLYS